MVAEFDGKVFVPSHPVDLPTGTRVEVLIPEMKRGVTPAENREWQGILDEIASSPPAFPTVEEALSRPQTCWKRSARLTP